MKTKIAGLLVAFLLITTLCMAQKNITVEAQNNDISNNLDLKAVATVFGESRDLEEFEKKLNDYDSQISNLDLNQDGQVDYLRVIEKNENGVHVVEIQAVLDKDVYQDVASIIVEKDQNDHPTVQVVGDPYIYGDNYIIEPGYLYTPSIFSFFWGPNYFMWNSPYYWGYYPTYYHHYRPYESDIYLSHVYSHVNHNQRYYYTNSIRNSYAAGIIRSSRRNDLGVRRPEQSFSNRNVNARSKRDFEFNRNAVNAQGRSSYQGVSSGARPVRAFDNGNSNQGAQNGGRTNTNNAIRTNVDTRNTNQRIYTTPANPQNQNVNRLQNNNPYQNRQSAPSTQNRTITVEPRNQNNSYRPTQSVSQPTRVNENRQPAAVRSTPSVSTPSASPSRPAAVSAPRVESKRESRSSDSRR